VILSRPEFLLETHCLTKVVYETPLIEGILPHSLPSTVLPLRGFMNESQTNSPSATEAGPTSSLSGSENPENTPPADEAITSAPDTQSSPPSQPSKAFEIFTRIKHTIGAKTHLSDANIAVAAFWVISTWFQDALTLLPCLAITGPDHEANELLSVLHELCSGSLLLAGFRRRDLMDVSQRTLLISEPHLSNQNAALLGNLTNRGFMIVEQRYYLFCHSSKAIYIGDSPTIKRIQHAIYIDVTPALNAEKRVPPEGVELSVEDLNAHLAKYRERNLAQVRRLEFSPTGVSPETGAVAKALGSCIVDATDLQAALVSILSLRDRQQISERLDTAEALIVEAVLALSSGGANQLYAREIAVEVNRLIEVRNERSKLSPEKVGHRLRKLGLPTRRLSQTGNGLVMDKETRTRLQMLSAMYVREDQLAATENFHSPQATEKREVEEVM
jgi:hypothetical protein